MKTLTGSTLVLMVAFTACKTTSEQTKVLTQADYPAAPVATKKPQVFNNHGYTRTDDYFWLKDKTNPETIA